MAELTAKFAIVPLNRTAVAPVKLLPLIVTLVPTGPPAGVKLVIAGALETVTVTGSEVHRRPSRSRPTAVRVWEPLPAAVVSHDIPYGADVSSAPKLTPSSLNWTPTTVREPMIVVLALTGVEPETVDPDLGEVMVTTRVPKP